MKKSIFAKILCTALAIIMIIGCFAGCGDNGNSAAFKIGGVGPLTGGNAVYGQAVMRGAQIAVDEINALGDIQLEFKSADDVSEAETSVLKAVFASATISDGTAAFKSDSSRSGDFNDSLPGFSEDMSDTLFKLLSCSECGSPLTVSEGSAIGSEWGWISSLMPCAAEDAPRSSASSDSFFSDGSSESETN